MSALNGSWNFLSGLIVQFGAAPAGAHHENKRVAQAVRRQRQNKRHTRRLTKDERAELLASIRHDDWFE